MSGSKIQDNKQDCTVVPVCEDVLTNIIPDELESPPSCLPWSPYVGGQGSCVTFHSKHVEIECFDLQ